MTDLASERAESMARQRRRDRERLAACALRDLGHLSSIEEIRLFTLDRWQVEPEEAELIAAAAIRIQSEMDPCYKHLAPETLENEMKPELSDEIRDVTRELLTGNPKMGRQECYEAVLARLGSDLPLKFSSFETGYFYKVRRDLGIEPPASSGGRPKRKIPKREAPPEPKPAPKKASQVREHLRARLRELEEEAEELRTALRILEKYDLPAAD